MSDKTLSPEDIARLLEPYIGSFTVPPGIYPQLAVYLELIFRWNARINLTAIRDPADIVRRHFGESLFAGLHLDAGIDGSTSTDANRLRPCDSLLDLGSGAGFPGIPIHLLYPDLPITLAESRTRKAAFLREVARTLGLATEVWADRAESMAPDRRFHTVTLRAVDDMDAAVSEAAHRAVSRILILATRTASYPTLPSSFALVSSVPLPNSVDGVLWIAQRTLVTG